MIYLIIGRFASGRHYLADILKNNLPENKTANADVMDAICEGDIVIQNNIIITSPDRYSNITESDPGEAFAIIHVESDDMDRKLNYVKNAEKKIKAEELFDAENDKENQAYVDFELMLHDVLHANGSINALPANVTRCYHYVNDYSPNTAVTNADNIFKENLLNRKVTEIIETLHSKGLIQGKTDSDRLSVAANDGSTKLVSASYFAELISENADVFANTMKMWLVARDDDLTPDEALIDAVNDND